MHAEIKKQTLALSDILDEFLINRLGKLMFKTVVNSFFLERRTTRGVRVVLFFRARMRSSNSARISKSYFTTEKIV